MKNRRKRLAAMLLALTMAGLAGGEIFGISGISTAMAGTEGQTEAAPEDENAESNAAGAEEITETTEQAEATETTQQAEANETTETTEPTGTSETGEAPQVAITISAPKDWQKEKAVVTITVEDTKQTGNFSLAKMEAKISEEGNWTDITASKSIEVSKNGSVYVKVTDQNGKVYTENRYIESFDTTKPTLSAAAKDGMLVIQGADEGSGVAAIYVNGNEFTDLTDNTLKVRLQQADTTYEYFTLQVRDKAGNMSENYKVANPYYENPETKKTENSSTNTGSANTDITGSAAGNSGNASSSLPSDAAPSKPTSATGTVTEHTESNASESATDDSDSAQAGTSTGTAKETGKEFYTITTKGDKVFYLIVDKDKTSDNVYLLTEVGENDLLNFTDSNTVTLPQNSAVTESALPDGSELETGQVETEEKPEKEEVKKTEKSSNAGTYVLIVLVLLGVGGAYYYLKFIKGGKDSFDTDFDEEEEDEYETEMVDLDDSGEYESDEEEPEYEEDREQEGMSGEEPEDGERTYSDEEEDYL